MSTSHRTEGGAAADDLRPAPPAGVRNGMWERMGFQVVEACDGVARLRCRPDDGLKLGGGQVHGGVVATLADSAMASALLSLAPPGSWAATIDLTVSYLAPVMGGEIVAEATVIKHGRSVSVITVEVRDEAGQLVAKALINAKAIPGKGGGARSAPGAPDPRPTGPRTGESR